MKNKTILRITDYVNCKFENLDPLTRRKMIDETKHFIPSSRYMPAYKLGRWDGCKAFATMGGATYINMLDQIIPIVEKAGYDIELVDEREPIDFEFPEVDEFLLSDIFWPDGHPYAGEPIMLRDHQVRAIQSFFDNPQSMQEIATSAGKCLTAETKLKIFHNGVAPITESVGSLFDYIERTFDIEFKDNEEVDVSELNMEIDTPGYKTLITHLIKKFSLPIIKVTFTDNSTIRVSERHMFVLENGNTIQSSFLLNGSRIQTRNGTIEVEKIERDGIEDCYDISIEEPHLYYDANDILHHNTIITGALCKLVEDHGRTITIVPSKSLVVQTEVDYRNIGLDTGVFYGEKKEENKHHTIMTWQSLSSAWKNRHDDDGELFLSLIDGVVAVIVDESHTGKGNNLSELLSNQLSHIPLRWGLTGTIPKDAVDRLTLLNAVGPVVNKVSAKELQDKGIISQCFIHNIETNDTHVEFKSYHDEKSFLTSDPDRINYISGLISDLALEGNTLVLVERIETGQMLETMIEGSIFLSGSVKNSTRKEEYDSIQNSNNRVLIASFGIASTGISIPRIFNLVLIEPGKSFVRVIQSIGRGIRKAKDKDHVDIYDISSTLKYSSKHAKVRKTFYKDAEYPFETEKIVYNSKFR